MTNFIPIFPLDIVVYPGENLNVHIFEPRYKQLINDCHAGKKPFGIPTVLDKKMQEQGTLMEIVEMSEVYDNGEMDIKTKGLKILRILEVIKEVPDKLYCGAIVTYPENHMSGDRKMMQKLMSGVRELHGLLKMSKDFSKTDEAMLAYDIAHHIGLSIEEEYELLSLYEERQRLAYLKLHLAKVVTMMTSMEQLKEKIKLNGHFKNLSSFDI